METWILPQLLGGGCRGAPGPGLGCTEHGCEPGPPLPGPSSPKVRSAPGGFCSISLAHFKSQRWTLKLARQELKTPIFWLPPSTYCYHLHFEFSLCFNFFKAFPCLLLCSFDLTRLSEKRRATVTYHHCLWRWEHQAPEIKWHVPDHVACWWQGRQSPNVCPYTQCPFYQNALSTHMHWSGYDSQLKIQLLKYHPHPHLGSHSHSRERWLTTGQESFSLSQMNVSQCNQTLESLGMFWNRKALNWKVALWSFPFSCTRTVSSVGQLEQMG